MAYVYPICIIYAFDNMVSIAYRNNNVQLFFIT